MSTASTLSFDSLPRTCPFITLSSFYHVPSSKALYCRLLSTLSTREHHFVSLPRLLTSHHLRHFGMTPDETAALKKTIIEICTKHKEENWKKVNYRPCVFVPPCYFVKYGDPDTLWPEAATQRYISEYAKSQPDTPLKPRIADVVHYFEGAPRSYLVMEHITLTPGPPPPDFIERIAAAVKWLSDVPPPVDHVIGPLGGGRICHQFFKDHMAPLSFPSVAALERYMEKVRLCFPFLEYAPFAHVTCARGVRYSRPRCRI